MQGHAVANCMPVIACNRIGTEKATTSDLELTFFGSSFIADQLGVKVQEADSTSETVLVHTFDLEACRLTSRPVAAPASTGRYSAIAGRTCTNVF